MFIESIADGQHVDRELWPLVFRTKPSMRLILVSDGIELAATTRTHGTLGGLEIEVHGDRCSLVSNGGLAGSVITLDVAVRNLALFGVGLPMAAAAGSRNPAVLLGLADRGRIAPGLRADLIELDHDFRVQKVMRGGIWIATSQ